MSEEVVRKFDYRADSTGMRPLGYLSIILSIFAMVGSFQEGSEDVSFSSIVHITGPLAPWALRGLSILLLLVGISFIKLVRAQKGMVLPFTFLEDGVRLPGISTKTPYYNLTRLQIGKSRKGPTMTIDHPGGRLLLRAANMGSVAEFEEAVALLKSKTPGL